jgi:FimV-like protein
MTDAPALPPAPPTEPPPPPVRPGRGFFATRWELWTVAGLLALALALRLVTLHQAAAAPYYEDPILDGFVYDQWGQKIAHGQWAGGPQLYAGAPKVFYQDPLYPYFLGVLYLPGRSVLVARLAQVLIGLASCALLYVIGRRLFGRMAALVALAAAAAYKPFLFYDTLIMKSVLEVFFLLLATWLLLIAQDAERAGPGTGRRRRWWLLAGLALGVGALARGNYLLIVPALLVWLRAAFPADGWRGAVGRWGWIACGAAAGIAPATIHNAVMGHELILTTAQAGPNFYTGNHTGNQSGRYQPPAFVYGNPLLEEHDFRKEAEKRLGRRLSAGEVDRYWLKQGLRYAVTQPGAFLLGLTRKLFLFWHGYEYPDNNEDLAVMSRFMPVLRWPLPVYAIISPLAILGLGLSLLAWRRHLLPILLVLVYAGSLMLFFLFARYRLPAVPFLLLFAAHALVWMGGRLQEARARGIPACAGLATLFAATVAVLGLATSAAGVDLEAHGFGTFRPTVGHFNLAKYWYEKGRDDDARTELELALAIEEGRAAEGKPRWGRTPELLTDLALISIQKAQRTDPKRDPAGYDRLLADAKTRLDRALEIAPRFATAHHELGIWHRLRGETDAAVACFEQALAIQPALHDARLSLAETAWQRGDEAGARAALKEVLDAGTAQTRAEAHRLLGDMALRQGDTSAARASFEEALACSPMHLEAHRRLMNMDSALAEKFVKQKDNAAANYALVKAFFHAQYVRQLDPSDETAAVLMDSYQKALSKPQRQAPAAPVPAPAPKKRR